MRDQNKQDADKEDNMKVSILEPKLENVLKNSVIQKGRQKKGKKGQGDDKGKLQNHT